MSASSVPTAKANLVTQLQARPNLSGANRVLITNGPPVPPEREFIWVGTAEGEQHFGTFGAAGLRREEYGLQVVISVLREGADIVGADTRCFALSAEVEAQLRTDPTINGAVMAAEFGGFKLGEYVTADEMARGSELVVTVNCETWLS